MTEKPTEEYPIGALCVITGPGRRNLGKRVKTASAMRFTQAYSSVLGRKVPPAWRYDVNYLDDPELGPFGCDRIAPLCWYAHYLRRIDRDPDAEIKTDKEMEKVQ